MEVEKKKGKIRRDRGDAKRDIQKPYKQNPRPSKLVPTSQNGYMIPTIKLSVWTNC